MGLKGGNNSEVLGDGSAVASSGNCATLLRVLDSASGTRHALAQSPATFNASADLFELGCLRVCHFRSLAAWRMDCKGSLKAPERHKVWNVVIQLSGAMVLRRQSSPSIRLSAGDWCILAPFDHLEVNGECPASFVVLVVPAHELASVEAMLNRISERRIDGDSAAARLLFRFATDMLNEAAGLASASRLSFSHALMQILKSAILDLGKPQRNQAAQEVLYRRACEMIEGDLGNERLSVDYLAQRLGCSRRYLHYIFARIGAGQAPASYIRERRLARCRAELTIRGSSGRTIAEIAHGWGFHDPAHFARLFRQAYGITPAAFTATMAERTSAALA